MPSKAKKNKRRMRRVQAQRRRLEELHAANPPVKATPSIAVGAPGTASKKAAKKAAPQKVQLMVCKVPEAVPVFVTIAEAPKIIPEVEPPKEEPVVTPVEVEAVAVLEPEPEPVLEPEPVPVPELEPEPEVVVHEVEIPEVPGNIIVVEQIEEATPEEATPVEVIAEEATPVEVTPVEVVQEVEEPIIPEAEPENEVTLQVETPVSAPAEIEIVPEETAVITEIEQTHDVCEPEPTAFTEEVASEAVVEPLTEETEECIVQTEVTEEISVDAEIEELSVEDSEDGSAVEVAVDESQSIEPEPTEVVEVIPVDAPAEDVEADIEDVASQSEESELVDSGPVEVAEDEPETIEPESVEGELTEEVTVAVPQEVMETEVVETDVVETEVTVECVENEPVAEEEKEEEESCSSQEEEEEDYEMEVLSEEAPAETNHITEDIAIPNEEISVEQDALPLPLLTPAPEPVSQIEEVPVDTADIMVDDFVVTDTEVIEPKTIELLPVFEKPIVKMTPEPELITAAEDTLNGADVEELMPEQCPIPLDQESVTNTSINTLIGTEWMAQQQVPGLDC